MSELRKAYEAGRAERQALEKAKQEEDRQRQIAEAALQEQRERQQAATDAARRELTASFVAIVSANSNILKEHSLVCLWREAPPGKKERVHFYKKGSGPLPQFVSVEISENANGIEFDLQMRTEKELDVTETSTTITRNYGYKVTWVPLGNSANAAATEFFKRLGRGDVKFCETWSKDELGSENWTRIWRGHVDDVPLQMPHVVRDHMKRQKFFWYSVAVVTAAVAAYLAVEYS